MSRPPGSPVAEPTDVPPKYQPPISARPCEWPKDFLGVDTLRRDGWSPRPLTQFGLNVVLLALIRRVRRRVVADLARGTRRGR